MEKTYICCRVLVRDFEDHYFTLSYLSTDESVQRDDFVIVPCGRNNTRKIGRVIRVKRCCEEKLPLPLERMKYILSKTARPADWDESRKTPVFPSQKRAEKKKAEISAAVKTEEKKPEPKPEPCPPQRENAAVPRETAEQPAKQPTKHTAPKDAGKKRRWIWAAVLLCLAAAALTVAVRMYRQTIDSYREGLREISAREYVAAEQRFSELGSFRDSEAFSVYCHYMFVYENNTEYAGGEREISALALRYETDWQSRIDTLAVRIRTYKRIQEEREAAEAVERREREAAEAAERREADLQEKYSGKLPENGMPMDALKYTSLGEPNSIAKCADFDYLSGKNRFYYVLWRQDDDKLVACGQCYQSKSEYLLRSFYYFDPPRDVKRTGNAGTGRGSRPRLTYQDLYDSFDEFWEENQDEYADEEEAWDDWCDG